MRPIRIDAMRAVWLTTPLCRWSYIQSSGTAMRLCAVSALAVAAGVPREAIQEMQDTALGATCLPHAAFWTIWREHVVPSLERAYGLPVEIITRMPKTFDAYTNEQDGLDAILVQCEAWNQEHGGDTIQAVPKETREEVPEEVFA